MNKTPHHPHDRRTRTRPRGIARGFTLIEILIVISIIAILTGILVAAFMNRQGPQSATRITLSALKGAAVEYEVELQTAPVSMNQGEYASQVRTNFSGGQYIDPNEDPPKAKIGGTADTETNFRDFSISRFCHQLLKYPTTNKMLMSLGREVIIDADGDGFADVVDGWGRKIVYYNPADNFDRDNDENQKHAELFPASRTPYFASAGEDGQWGDYRELQRFLKKESQTAAEEKLALEAQDNLYSFEMGN